MIDQAPPVAYEATSPDVESFVQNKDGSSTLTVRCANGKAVQFKIPKDKVDLVNIDQVYSILNKECK